LSLAVWVSGVCLLALGPLLAFSTFMVYREIAEQQRQGLEALERRASTAASALGHELDRVFTELAALSRADGLPEGDLRATYDRAVHIVRSDPGLASISLSAPSGRQPFITSRPFGSVLPDSNATSLLRPLFEGAERVVSPLIVGAVSQQAVVGVALPIDLGPAGVFALRAVIRLEAIGARFNELGWPADWTAAVIDQNGVIVARSRDAERFIGQPSMPGVLERVKKSTEPFHASTMEGLATVASGAPVPGTDWYVVVGLPAAALDAQVRDSMAAILLAGALCALLGIGAAVFTARSIGAQLRQVVNVHVRGEPDSGSDGGIREVNEIAKVLASARAATSEAFSEVEAARENALAQLRERGEMLDVLAHEVRQPLNNASAALQEANGVILRSVSPEVLAPLSRANGVLTEVLASIDNTLAVAALLVGDKPISRVDFDIDALVSVSIADMAADQASRVRVERATLTRTASMEPNLLRLALRNLLSNALKFSPRESPVTVRISDSDEPLAVVLDVIDHGAGIAAERLPRLFDRGDRTAQNLGGRRQGLGLYIVRRVMQLHQGTVTLESNGENGITVMRLMIVQSEAP
jgi:signal transduction histidine kinase